MKIGILTIQFGRNYGSVLQAYALNKYLTDEGNSVKTINYIPSRFSFKERYRAGKEHNFFVQILASILRFPKNYFQYKVFNDYLYSNVPLTKKVSTTQELHNLSKEFDLIVVGSDQVWNYKYNVNCQETYYLNFCSVNKIKKISYAASFGVDNVPNEELVNIKKYLSTFDDISVREKQGIHILDRCGIKSQQCIDPVFLLEDKTWREIAGIKMNKFDYVLVYALGGNEQNSIDYAISIADKLKLKIIYIGFSKLKSEKIYKQLIYASPKEFLSLIRNANFVVTNSFHATAFSIIFEKNFITLEREKFNSRINDILDKCNLTDRIVPIEKKSVLDDRIFEKINYKIVKSDLSNYIKKSKKFLSDSYRKSGMNDD